MHDDQKRVNVQGSRNSISIGVCPQGAFEEEERDCGIREVEWRCNQLLSPDIQCLFGTRVSLMSMCFLNSLIIMTNCDILKKFIFGCGFVISCLYHFVL